VCVCVCACVCVCVCARARVARGRASGVWLVLSVCVRLVGRMRCRLAQRAGGARVHVRSWWVWLTRSTHPQRAPGCPAGAADTFTACQAKGAGYAISQADELDTVLQVSVRGGRVLCACCVGVCGRVERGREGTFTCGGETVAVNVCGADLGGCSTQACTHAAARACASACQCVCMRACAHALLSPRRWHWRPAWCWTPCTRARRCTACCAACVTHRTSGRASACCLCTRAACW
jgi:hypothetical protein